MAVYNDYAYLYPPRPEKAVPRSMLAFYEKQFYLAQKKKNGTNTVIFAKGKEVIFKTRHADDHKMWSPKPEHIKFFQSDSNYWNVFCAELLHHKVAGIRDQLYIYDQIVEDSTQLAGTRFEERSLNLQARWSGTEECDQQRITPFISVAKNFTGDFGKLYDKLGVEDEGLVLKKANGILKLCFKANANHDWQVKCRIPHKNYSF